MKYALIAAFVLAAAPVRAQEVMGQSIGEGQKNAIQAGKALNSNEARAQRVIGNIACVGAAEISDVIDYVQRNMKIVFADQGEPAKLSGKTISLDQKLPDAPRVQIAYVVYEGAEASLSSFPDSVEKEYMRVSLATRGWMELGGEGNKLPVIDPDAKYKDEKLAAFLRAWYYGGIEQEIARANPKLGSIKDLKDAKAVKQFADFKKAESDWIMANGFRFQQ